MPLGPSDYRHFKEQSDLRKERTDTFINGSSGSGSTGPKTVGIKPNFSGTTYKNGTWQKK